MKIKYLFGALLSLAASQASALTNVPAIISSSQVWDISGSPYMISQDVLLKAGASIEVRPGVVIKGNGSLSITILGEFIALGKKDSMITIEGLTLDYQKGSVGYNVSTGMGSRIYYTHFLAKGTSTSYAVKLAGIKLRVDRSSFEGHTYACYGQLSGQDSTWLNITYSSFTHPGGQMYPVYGVGARSTILIDHCDFLNVSYCYAAEYTRVTNSYFSTHIYSTTWNVGSWHSVPRRVWRRAWV